MNSRKPFIGISTCLLGENVRYDGGHKLDHYLVDTLGKYVQYVPVCPESECGLGIPREAMRLVDVKGRIRLMTQRTQRDMTEKMTTWMKKKFNQLDKIPFCGFIFKSKSPSSGLFRVKVYRNGGSSSNGRGVFARGLTERYPLLPVEEDGRLHDSKLRENFIERVFTVHRWNELNRNRRAISRIMDFHARHKYILMAHCPETVKSLGHLLGGSADKNVGQIYEEYFESFIKSLSKLATVRKNTNVLEHMMGYFKKDLESDEKKELKQIIENYHQQLVPLIVPVTLLNHYVKKYSSEYLAKQFYLNPHPMELMLRNHV